MEDFTTYLNDRHHPGFALLRFLGMSSEWGKCDRWFVGNGGVPDGAETPPDWLENCSSILKRLVEEGADR